MAVSRVKTSSILQGFPKSRSLLAGNSYYVPPSFESIATTTVGSGGSSSVTFSSIPQTYTHLQIRALTRATALNALVIRYNSDATSGNYKTHNLEGNGATVTASTGGAVTSYGYIAYPTYSTMNANMFGCSITDILDYTNTNKNKVSKTLGSYDTNNTVDGYVTLFSNVWLSTAAITNIQIFAQSANFAQYSQIALYGIKG